jgi:hypothetical protein
VGLKNFVVSQKRLFRHIAHKLKSSRRSSGVFLLKKSELFADEPGPPVRGERRLEMRPPPTFIPVPFAVGAGTGSGRCQIKGSNAAAVRRRYNRKKRLNLPPLGFGRGGGDENFIPKDKGQPKPNERPQVEFSAVPRRYRRKIGASTVAVSGGKLPFDRRTDRPAQGQ